MSEWLSISESRFRFRTVVVIRATVAVPSTCLNCRRFSLSVIATKKSWLYWYSYLTAPTVKPHSHCAQYCAAMYAQYCAVLRCTARGTAQYGAVERRTVQYRTASRANARSCRHFAYVNVCKLGDVNTKDDGRRRLQFSDCVLVFPSQERN